MITKTEKVEVFKDETYEATIRLQLKDAIKSIQSLMNAWLDLNLGPCKNVNDLVMHPEKMYNDAVDSLVQVPVTTGPFKMKKDAVLASMELPNPEPLYALSKRIRQQPFCASSELWQVDIDGRIELNDREAYNLIAARSIYAATPEQVNLCRDLQKWCELTNKLNIRLNGELVQGANPFFNNWIRGHFKASQKSYPGPYEISVDPEYLQGILKRIA